MNAEAAQRAQPRLRPGRSIAAILLCILINFVLALGIDQLFHSLAVYPPWGAAMPDTGDNLLALSYRLVITVFAGVVALRFAGYAPRGHAIAIGAVGLALGTLGAIATTTGGADFGPDWYPWALAISAIPCTWAAYMIARKHIPS